MSSTLIGLIVLVVGVIFSACLAPAKRVEKNTSTRGPDVYNGDRKY